MELENDLLREVGRLTRIVQAIIEIKFKTLALQKGQSIYLTRIREHPGIQLKALSQLLAVDKTRASKVINKLVSENWVRRGQDPQDKRACRLYPTLKTKKAYASIIAEENRLTRKCYRGLTIGQQTSVLKLIRKLRLNIEVDWYALKK